LQHRRHALQHCAGTQFTLLTCTRVQILTQPRQAFLPATLSKRNRAATRQVISSILSVGAVVGVMDGILAAAVPACFSSLFTSSVEVHEKMVSLVAYLALSLALHANVVALEGVFFSFSFPFCRFCLFFSCTLTRTNPNTHTHNTYTHISLHPLSLSMASIACVCVCVCVCVCGVSNDMTLRQNRTPNRCRCSICGARRLVPLQGIRGVNGLVCNRHAVCAHILSYSQYCLDCACPLPSRTNAPVCGQDARYYS
jgi:hypothetical protein